MMITVATGRYTMLGFLEKFVKTHQPTTVSDTDDVEIYSDVDDTCLRVIIPTVFVVKREELGELVAKQLSKHTERVSVKTTVDGTLLH